MLKMKDIAIVGWSETRLFLYALWNQLKNKTNPWLTFPAIYFMVRKMSEYIQACSVPGSIVIPNARGLHIDHISLQEQRFDLIFFS